jgi:hypothetical protein
MILSSSDHMIMGQRGFLTALGKRSACGCRVKMLNRALTSKRFGKPDARGNILALS